MSWYMIPLLPQLAQSLVSVTVENAIGVPMGVYTGLHRESWLSRVFLTVSLIGISLPTFLIGILMTGATFGFIPMLTLFLIFQRDFIRKQRDAGLPLRGREVGLAERGRHDPQDRAVKARVEAPGAHDVGHARAVSPGRWRGCATGARRARPGGGRTVGAVGRLDRARLEDAGAGDLAVKIGEAARAEIAQHLGRKVHLFLHVKVNPRWDEDREMAGEAGVPLCDRMR